MKSLFWRVYTVHKLVTLLILTLRNASAREGDWSRTVRCSVFLWIVGRDWSLCCEVCRTSWWQTLEWSCNGVLLYEVEFVFVDISGTKRENLKVKIKELAMRSKNKNIMDLHRNIHKFKERSHSVTKLVKDENNDLLADSYDFLNRWKNYLSQLLNVRGLMMLGRLLDLWCTHLVWYEILNTV